MPKKNSYICIECNQTHTQWSGQCPDCKQWNSLELAIQNKISNTSKPIKEIKDFVKMKPPVKTELGNCDNVFGNGLTVGSITLIAGEPGIGKSTFLLQVLSSLSRCSGEKISALYVSGEESENQIFERAIRIDKSEPLFKVLSTSIWQDVTEVIKREKPSLVIIDSIQTIRDDEISSQAGSSTQLRAVTSDAIEQLKGRGITTILVGHVTKEGSIAGPKHVEHMVDTVLTFSKNDADLRVLKAKKNRFGAVGEEAQFRMTQEGLLPVSFEETIPKISKNEVGVTYSLTKKGNATTLVELQALVIENKYGQGRRVIQGADAANIHTILAVLEKELKIPLSNHDIYIKTNLENASKNRSLDMGICCAVLSSYHNVTLNIQRAWLGELRLGGVFKDYKIGLDENSMLKKCKIEATTSDKLYNSKKIDNVVALNNYLKTSA